jgi:hypothetical protein
MLDEQIRQAIAGRHVISYRYNGHRRIGEPHLYGTVNGQPKLLVYQTGGTSMAGPYPTWRRCDLSSIARFVVSTRTFTQTRLNASDAASEWDEIWAIVE